MGLSGTAQGWEWPKRSPIPKICHTYPAKIKVGCYTLPKEDPKNTCITRFGDISIFHRKSANFAISENANIDCIYIAVTILMMSAKVVAPSLLEIDISK